MTGPGHCGNDQRKLRVVGDSDPVTALAPAPMSAEHRRDRLAERIAWLQVHTACDVQVRGDFSAVAVLSGPPPNRLLHATLSAAICTYTKTNDSQGDSLMGTEYERSESSPDRTSATAVSATRSQGPGAGEMSARLADLATAMRPTPVLRIPHDRVELVMKMESSNPSGSTKDRPAYAILEDAVRRGLVEPSGTVVESSSGNMALSLLMFCRYLGLRFIPVIDPTINAPTERVLRLGCDRVEKVSGQDYGHLNARIDRVHQLLVEERTAFWPNQYANPVAAQAHYRFTGAELCDTVPELEYVFVGAGTGATLAGISQRVKQYRPRAKVVAVDVEGSVIFGSPAGRRRIPGIGSTIRPPLVSEAQVDEVVVVSERDTVLTCRRLARETGFLVGGSTGSVVAAVDRYFDRYSGRRPTVAVLCADRGSAYADTIYSDRWVSAELDLHPARSAGAISGKGALR